MDGLMWGKQQSSPVNVMYQGTHLFQVVKGAVYVLCFSEELPT